MENHTILACRLSMDSDIPLYSQLVGIIKQNISSGKLGVGDLVEAFENNDDLQLMDQFKMDLKEDEVYVFTPKGDLLNFPKGATVLDFAYYI